MKTIQCKQAYYAGDLTKLAYIDEMFKNHGILAEYPELIKDTNIRKIEIEDGQLIATTRDKNIRLLCSTHDKRLVPYMMINFNDYEKNEIECMLDLVKRSRSTTIFDVGANIGYISLCIAHSFPDTTIHAFEPIPSTYALLCENIALNNTPTIHPHPYGLSDTTQDVEFYFYPEASANASLQQLVEIDTIGKVKTCVKRLDEVTLAINAVPDFIKCDVEGAELLVFKGAEKTLATAHPIVYTEMLRKWSAKFNYHPNDIIQLFSALNYACFTIHEGNLKPFGKVTDLTVETNYFFLHTEKHASIIRAI